MRLRRASAPVAGLALLFGLGVLPCHWATAQADTHADAQAQAQPALELRVTLAEWSLTPSSISVPVGRTVRFLAQNAGILPHALAVEGPGVYAESATVGSGGAVPFEVLLTVPGVYDVFCPVNAGEHRRLGQEGVLTVLPGTSSLALPATGDPGHADLPTAPPPALPPGTDPGIQ